MAARLRMVLFITGIFLLLTTTSAFAKGNFTFLIVSGAGLPGNIYLADPAITADFFGFADFMHAKTSQPANPGIGYEVTRYYVDQGRREAFDRLHYYPETGYVYYDGIVNGSSEYDGKWYVARAEVRPLFERDVVTASIAELRRQQPFLRRS